MAEQRVTGSSQRNAKDVAYELTELYYTTVVDKEKVKEASPEEVAETYMKYIIRLLELNRKIDFAIYIHSKKRGFRAPFYRERVGWRFKIR